MILLFDVKPKPYRKEDMKVVIDVRKLLEESMESTEPQDSILALLRKYDGKRVNRKLIDTLNQEIPNQDIKRSIKVNIVVIEYGGYSKSGGKQGGCLWLDSESPCIVKVEEIEKRNASHFSALKERNEQRKKALENPEDIAKLENYMMMAIKGLEWVEGYIGNGKMFEVVRYRVKEVIEQNTDYRVIKV